MAGLQNGSFIVSFDGKSAETLNNIHGLNSKSIAWPLAPPEIPYRGQVVPEGRGMRLVFLQFIWRQILSTSPLVPLGYDWYSFTSQPKWQLLLDEMKELTDGHYDEWSLKPTLPCMFEWPGGETLGACVETEVFVKTLTDVEALIRIWRLGTMNGA